MALSVLVALMMLAVPLASSSNLFVDGGQTNSNGDAPVLGASSNDDIKIKDVYIIKTTEELKALPIYDKLKSVLSKDDDGLSTYAPCLITIYTTNGNVVGDGPSGDKLGVKFDVSYTKDGTSSVVKNGGYSGMKLYDSAKNEYYATFPLGTFAGDGDSLDITNAEYYYQKYTVTADLYDTADKKVDGKSVSMTSDVDNIEVNEVWMIDDQTSFNKINESYHKDLTKYIKDKLWGTRNPWIAIAFTAESAGTYVLEISALNGLSAPVQLERSVSAPGQYVIVVTLGSDDGGTGDKLGMDNKYHNNNIYNIEMSANGKTSVGSVTYGNISGTYDVIFKLNADETSLDLAKVDIPKGVTGAVSWKLNSDGDLVASVTISKDSKVSIEYLITQIYSNILKNGHALIEWTSDDGTYTNMSYSDATNPYGSSQTKAGDVLVTKNLIFTATWELNEGWVYVPIHVNQDGSLIGDYIKAYEVKEKNTISVDSTSLGNVIADVLSLNTYGVVVNDEKGPSIQQVYSFKVTYGDSKEIPADKKIASSSELSVNYDLNTRIYSKILVHSEAFKDGKDVTLFALNNKDYTYYQIFDALQYPKNVNDPNNHDVKPALTLNGGIDKNKNATTLDNYYLLTGWDNGTELLDSQRNAPAELTLDAQLNGYYVVFMANGQFEVVYVPYGELSADKCTIASNVKYWSYIDYASYTKGTFSGLKTFSFAQSQIKVIEDIAKPDRDDRNAPVVVIIASDYSFNNTAYAVFDATSKNGIEGNFGNKYVDKIIISGKSASGSTTNTIPLPSVTPVYEDDTVFIEYSSYSVDGVTATFGAAGDVRPFSADVVLYKYTITFYNGSEVNGIFYYSDESTMTEDITPNLVAFSYKGTAYRYPVDSESSLEAFNNILFPAKDGYTPAQWKDVDGKVMIDKLKEATGKNATVSYELKFDKLKSDLNLYISFEAKKYLIAYNGNTATATNNLPQIGTVDVSLNLFIDAAFSNNGYKIKEWNTSPDGKGTSYALGVSFTLSGEDYENLSKAPTGSGLPSSEYEKGFTLYAIWEKSSSASGSGDNTDGDNGSNTDTYLLAGILIVVIVLILLMVFLMRKRN